MENSLQQYLSYSNTSRSRLIGHYQKRIDCSDKDDELETINNKLRDVKAHDTAVDICQFIKKNLDY